MYVEGEINRLKRIIILSQLMNLILKGGRIKENKEAQEDFLSQRVAF